MILYVINKHSSFVQYNYNNLHVLVKRNVMNFFALYETCYISNMIDIHMDYIVVCGGLHVVNFDKIIDDLVWCDCPFKVLSCARWLISVTCKRSIR